MDPRAELEEGLFTLLSENEAVDWPVYNSRAVGSSFGYIVFSVAGSDDLDYHRKVRGYLYGYQVVGISRNRATALAMNEAIDGAMDLAVGDLELSAYVLIDVRRVQAIDYAEVTPDGELVYHVGGIYEIEVEIGGD
jgi:hypothetical protein